MYKKLLALNLCFLMLFSAFAFTANAAEAAPAYSITVNGTEFSSAVDASDTGWTYSASEGILTLDGYEGSTIKASGDLVIYARNEVNIYGVSTGVYSAESCGIVVNGTLVLDVDGDVTISGAIDSAVKGGEAIVAAKAVISSDTGSDFNVNGGNNAVAIKANELEISTKQMNVNGGSDASAIYFSSLLTVNEKTNAVIRSGADSKYAITYLSSASYSINDDVTATFYENSSKIVFTSKTNFIYGDTNSDGEVDSKDAVLLAQHLAKWNVELNKEASDTNADGEVDSKDAVLLAQFLAKWAVELG
ncbi:MAG: hypothetical protein IJZ89_08330 [Clostridia bacterium]|nr:hypothetical protein [Clostridia bacterium]